MYHAYKQKPEFREAYFIYVKYQIMFGGEYSGIKYEEQVEMGSCK